MSMKKLRRKYNEREELLDKQDMLRARNDIAMREDLSRRFSGYEDDISVGNMYQRKRKTKKTKVKRKIKGCGCK